MPTYQLIQRACDFDLPPEKTVTAACIHTDDDFVRFHAADHELVYAVQRGVLLAIETVADQEPDQDACAVAEPEPDQPTTIGIKLDGRAIYDAMLRGATTVNRHHVARQFGWTIPQVNELPGWLVSWLLDAH